MGHHPYPDADRARRQLRRHPPVQPVPSSADWRDELLAAIGLPDLPDFQRRYLNAIVGARPARKRGPSISGHWPDEVHRPAP